MAISNVRSVPLGGGVSMYCSDFTASIGGAAQTLAIGAGRVLGVIVTPNATTEPVDTRNLVSWTTSGAITTITINNTATVSGTLIVVMDNGA